MSKCEHLEPTNLYNKALITRTHSAIFFCFNVQNKVNWYAKQKRKKSSSHKLFLLNSPIYFLHVLQLCCSLFILVRPYRCGRPFGQKKIHSTTYWHFMFSSQSRFSIQLWIDFNYYIFHIILPAHVHSVLHTHTHLRVACL